MYSLDDIVYLDTVLRNKTPFSGECIVNDLQMAGSQKELKKVYEFMIEAGVKLEAKCTTVATGILFLHRFISSTSLSIVSSELQTVAAACLYLAGKVQEDFIRIRDIINVTHRILHPDEPPLEVGELYWNIREGIGQLEMFVLRTLDFHLRHELPHQYLLNYLYALEGWVDRDLWQKCPVARTAWNLLCDSFIDPQMILDHKPQHLAASALYIALRIYGISVPYADSNEELPWWKIVCDIDIDNILKLANQILAVCNE